jgi:ribose 5-phosphate isomerase
MGLGMRIFIVKDDGSLERLPVGRYNRLLQPDSNERLLQYADRRVRCAVIVVESKDRIPVEIVKSQYSYLLFDHEGRLLMEWDEKEAQLAMDMLEPVIADKDKQVVDARHKFARKRYAREYLWQPSPEIEAAIQKAIFGRLETGRS